MQPIIVLELKNNKSQLISGKRRATTAKKCKSEIIPAIVFTNLCESEILEMQLIENLQREDLSTYEKALAFKKLVKLTFKDELELDKVDKTENIVKLLSNKLFSLTAPDVPITEVDKKDIQNLKQMYRYILLFMFPEECIDIVKNNPTFPVSAFEILLKYKNDPEVIKIFNLITEGKLAISKINEYLKKLNITPAENDKKQIRLTGKLKRIYADIDLLANQEVYLEDTRY